MATLPRPAYSTAGNQGALPAEQAYSSVIWAGLPLLLAAALIVLPAATWVGVPDWIPIFGAAAVILGLAIYEAVNARRAGLNPWATATTLTLLLFSYRFGVGLIVIFLWDYFPWEADPHLAYKFHLNGIRENLVPAAQLATIGIIGIYLGIKIPVKRLVQRLPKVTWRVEPSTFRLLLMLYTPIGICGLLFSAVAPPAIRFPLNAAGSITYVLIMIAVYYLFTARSTGERIVWSVYITVACGAALIMGFLSGLIGNILFPMLSAVFGFSLYKKKMPWKTLIAAALIGFNFIFPLLQMYKRVYFESKGLPIAQRFEVVSDRFSAGGWRLGLENTYEHFFGRMAAPDMIAAFVRAYPNTIPFLHGESLLYEIEGMLPRVLSPDKGVTVGPESLMNRYSAEIGLVTFGKDTSLALDAITEYYINFGAVGVLLLCMLQGVYVRFISEWLFGRIEQPIAGAFNAGLVLTNFDVFGIGQDLAVHIKLLPIWIGALYMMSRRWVPKRRLYEASYYRR
jgi:hypothetical protein